MKPTILFLTSLLALSSFADQSPETANPPGSPASRHSFNPITEFNEGMYLGLGRYLSEDGRSDYYSSYAVFFSHTWELVYLSSRGTHAYNMQFDINEFGFLQIELTQHYRNGAMTRADNPAQVYTGHGWCGSTQCQYTINVGNDRINETITFHPANGMIYRVGNIHMNDDDGQSSVIVWEESLSRIDIASEKIK